MMNLLADTDCMGTCLRKKRTGFSKLIPLNANAEKELLIISSTEIGTFKDLESFKDGVKDGYWTPEAKNFESRGQLYLFQMT
jgi:hypothetical protein